MLNESDLCVTAATHLPTRHGTFVFESFRLDDTGEPHLAISKGLGANDTPLVRMHSECMTGDVFGSVRCDCGDQLHEALGYIAESGCGVLIYLRQEGRGIGIEKKIQAYALQDMGLDTVDANLALNEPVDARSYDAGVAYLKRKLIRRCVLLTNNPEKVHALEGHGIDVVRRRLWTGACAESAAYLETKRKRMGHLC